MNIDEIIKKKKGGTALNKSEQAFYDNYRTKNEYDLLTKEYEFDVQNSNLDQAKKEELRKRLIMDRDIGASDAFNATQGALDIGKAGFGLSQIQQGKQQLDYLNNNRPEITPFERNQDLERRLSEANRDRQQGLSGATKQMYEQQLLDNSMQGQRMAETASSGQAGLFGALSQNQANQRAIERLKFASMNQEAKMQGDKTYDGLLANQMNESEEMRQRRDADQIRKQSEWKGDLQGARAMQNVGTENILNVMEMQPYRAGNYAKQYFNTSAQRNPDYINSSIGGPGVAGGPNNNNGRLGASSSNNFVNPQTTNPTFNKPVFNPINPIQNNLTEIDDWEQEVSSEKGFPLDNFKFKYGTKKKYS